MCTIFTISSPLPKISLLGKETVAAFSNLIGLVLTTLGPSLYSSHLANLDTPFSWAITLSIPTLPLMLSMTHSATTHSWISIMSPSPCTPALPLHLAFMNWRFLKYILQMAALMIDHHDKLQLQLICYDLNLCSNSLLRATKALRSNLYLLGSSISSLALFNPFGFSSAIQASGCEAARIPITQSALVIEYQELSRNRTLCSSPDWHLLFTSVACLLRRFLSGIDSSPLLCSSFSLRPTRLDFSTASTLLAGLIDYRRYLHHSHSSSG